MVFIPIWIVRRQQDTRQDYKVTKMNLWRTNEFWTGGWWRKTRSRARPEIEPRRKGRGQVIVTPVSENPQHPTQLPNTDKGYKVNTVRMNKALM